jgi:hypothetical protein
MVCVDTPSNTTLVRKPHHPGEGLRDRDPARRTPSRLLDDQHDRVAEVTGLLDLNVKAADRFGESLEKGTQLITGVVGADLILELHLRVEEGIELKTQFARPVHLLDKSTDLLNVLLRHAYSESPAASRAAEESP